MVNEYKPLSIYDVLRAILERLNLGSEADMIRYRQAIDEAERSDILRAKDYNL